MTEDRGPGRLDKLRWANTEYQHRLDRQALSSASIDTKASTALGFAIALGAFVLTQVELGSSRLIPLLIVAAACGASAFALSVRKFQDSPDLSEEYTRQVLHPDVEELTCLEVLIEARSEAFVSNAAIVRCKALCWRISAWSLLLAGVATSVLVLI